MNLQDQRILVTGGAGFIGSHLLDRLRRTAAEVHVLDSFFTGRREHLQSADSWSRMDVRDADEVHRAVHEYEPTAIVHLAAIHHIPYCNDHPEETFDVNVMGTRHLLSAASTLPDLSSVLYASSAAVYPPENRALDEETPPGPIDIYGRTKLIGEDLVEGFARDTGVDAVSARLFNVYGPRETNMHLVPAIIEQLRDEQRTIELGNLHPKRDFVSVHDVARALVDVLRGFEGGYRTYNIGTGSAQSVRQVLEHVGAALDSSLEVEQDEQRVREVDRENLQADIGRIQREIGWTPDIDLSAGLTALLQRDGLA